jgi:cytoskeleton protein RodZ
MDVGATLQSARERSGLSLEDVARRTKVSVRVLRAIEANAFDTVPGGIFTRGYLRAYAREVGLDPGDTVAQFLGGFDSVDSLVEPSSRSRTEADPLDDAPVVTGYAAYESGSEAGKAIAIALASLGFLAYLSLSGPPDHVETPTDDGVAALPAAPATETASAVMLASDSAQPVATAGEILDVEVRATGPCWVEATADGSRRVYRLMQAGDRETFAVQDTLVLRVGNPGAFAFSVNGRPADLPGRPGQPVTIRIGPENFTDFLTAT